MNFFVYEHITSGALINQPLSPSLAGEGNSMLQAIINDLLLLSELNITILRDHRLAPLQQHANSHKLRCHYVAEQGDFQHYYQQAINHADFIFIIAPETEGILAQLQQSIVDQDKFLVGCQPQATRLCSDKYRCYQQLTSKQIASATTLVADHWSQEQFDSLSGYIVKDRDGAGCLNTLFFADKHALNHHLSTIEDSLQQTVVQPYIAGDNISLSLLYSDREVTVLAINQQYINNDDGQIHFNGCRVNGVKESQFSLGQATVLARQIHTAIPGLWGFVGIDLILNDEGAIIIDINPRLTTSYIGLHRSIKLNPAQLLVDIIDDNSSLFTDIVHRQAIEVSV